MSDEIAHLPAWVRRRDGSQVPFEPDRICQSLFAAAETLGTPSAFLIRELTDVVLHFLGKDPFDGIPTTTQIAVEVEKVVREVGHPELAQRFADLQQHSDAAIEIAEPGITVDWTSSPQRFVANCLEAYALQAIFSRDVAAAAREGLIRLSGLDAPAALSCLVLETPRLAELPWWLALDPWREAGGARWIVESPEWLCTPQMHPALTPHLCERLLSLPTLSARDVELHLNIAEPPSWSPGRAVNPLFSTGDDDGASPERSNFLDGLLERWKSLEAPRVPSIAWHVQANAFTDDAARRQLLTLIRLALAGRDVRFLFDRPSAPITLADGLDRKCPGILLEASLDLGRLADRADVAHDGVVFLKKLPSLARIAVSAAAQKRQYLRRLPDQSPLKRRFLIERAAGVVAPLGLDVVVQSMTGADVAQSSGARDFALAVMRTLRDTLQQASRSINLDLRLAGPTITLDAAAEPEKYLDLASRLNAGAAVRISNADDGLDMLRRAWQSSVGCVRLERAAVAVMQGEFPAEPEA